MSHQYDPLFLPYKDWHYWLCPLNQFSSNWGIWRLCFKLSVLYNFITERVNSGFIFLVVLIGALNAWVRLVCLGRSTSNGRQPCWNLWNLRKSNSRDRSSHGLRCAHLFVCNFRCSGHSDHIRLSISLTNELEFCVWAEVGPVQKNLRFVSPSFPKIRGCIRPGDK